MAMVTIQMAGIRLVVDVPPVSIHGPVATAAVSSSSTARARHESLNFMTDVPDTEWRLLKEKVQSMHPNVKGGNITTLLRHTARIAAGTFFQEHFEPNFSCRHERRLGVWGDGGKWVCDPHRLPTPCLVYSVGSNGEASFEAAIHNFAPQCEIHTFDPEPRYQQVVENMSGGHFHAWGIAAQSTTTNPLVDDQKLYKTLSETMAALGHTGRTIDILKMNCEGCEWTMVKSLLAVDIRQILIELHAVRDNNVGKNGRRNDHKIPMPAAAQFFADLQRHGYVIFHKEANIQYWDYLSCVEYGFLKLHPDIFSSRLYDGDNDENTTAAARTPQ
jgi:hypothetical protein